MFECAVPSELGFEGGRRCSAQRALYLVARIDNADHITAAYGAKACEAIFGAVHGRAVLMLDDAGTISWSGRGRLDILILDPVRLCGRGRGRPDDCGEAHILKAALTRLAGEPVMVDDVAILPVVTVALASFEAPDGVLRGNALVGLGEALHARIERARIDCPTPRPGKACADYIADMDVATAMLGAMREERLSLAWQPVVSADADSVALYHEGLLRMVERGGVALPADGIVAALERIGLVRALDCQVVLMTIEQLRAHPGLRLGCNISAQSAVVDGWWLSIMADLERAPDVASRLVVEIGSDAALPDVPLAIEFVGRLRQLGCRVALDAFGIVQVPIWHLTAFVPDVVKIDGFFLRHPAQRHGTQRDALSHMVGLARSFAEVVIVCGVEDEHRCAIARGAGAEWLQGDHMGAPDLNGPAMFKQDERYLGGCARAASPDRAAAEPHAADEIEQSRLGLLRGLCFGAPISALMWLGLFGLLKVLT